MNYFLLDFYYTKIVIPPKFPWKFLRDQTVKRFCLLFILVFRRARKKTGRRSGARSSYISQTKEIIAPPSWTKAFKNNSSLFKFFFASNTQRKSNIWTTPSYST